MAEETKPRPRPKTVAQWKEARRERYRRAGDKGGFRVMPIKVMDSDAFNELGKSAKIALMLGLSQLDYWHKKHKGLSRRDSSIGPLRNDGRFSLPNNLLIERGIKGTDTIARIRRELVAVGFWETVETGSLFNAAIFRWSDKWTQYNQRSIEERRCLDASEKPPGYCLYPNITKYNNNIRTSKDSCAPSQIMLETKCDAQEPYGYPVQMELFPELIAIEEIPAAAISNAI